MANSNHKRRRMWIKGDTLALAVQLGMRPEVGDGLLLVNDGSLNARYRGYRTTVIRVEDDIPRDVIFHIVPRPEHRRGMCWVRIHQIAAIGKMPK